MAITYSQLRQGIQDYLEDTETTFVDNLDRIIRNAEDRILHLVNIPDFRKNATSSTSVSGRLLATPEDFLSPHSIELNDGTDWEYLLNKDVNFIDAAFPARTSGVPRFYAVWDDDNFLLGPTPDAAYTVELHYYARPTSIVDSGDGTSWLGNQAENALLYASIVEAYTFLKGEQDLMQVYEGRFQEAMSRLSNLGVKSQMKDDYRTSRRRPYIQFNDAENA